MPGLGRVQGAPPHTTHPPAAASSADEGQHGVRLSPPAKATATAMAGAATSPSAFERLSELRTQLTQTMGAFAERVRASSFSTLTSTATSTLTSQPSSERDAVAGAAAAASAGGEADLSSARGTANLLAASLQTSVHMLRRWHRRRSDSFSMSGEPADDNVVVLDSDAADTGNDYDDMPSAAGGEDGDHEEEEESDGGEGEESDQDSDEDSSNHDARRLNQHRHQPPHHHHHHNHQPQHLAAKHHGEAGGRPHLPQDNSASQSGCPGVSRTGSPDYSYGYDDVPIPMAQYVTRLSESLSERLERQVLHRNVSPTTATTTADSTYGYDELPMPSVSAIAGRMLNRLQPAATQRHAPRVQHETDDVDTTYGYDDILQPIGRHLRGMLGRQAVSLAHMLEDAAGMAGAPDAAGNSSDVGLGLDAAAAAVDTVGTESHSVSTGGGTIPLDAINQTQTGLTDVAEQTIVADEAPTGHRAAEAASEADADDIMDTVGYDDFSVLSAQQYPLTQGLGQLAQRMVDAAPRLPPGGIIPDTLREHLSPAAVMNKARVTALALRARLVQAAATLREQLTVDDHQRLLQQTVFHPDFLNQPNLLRGSDQLEPHFIGQYVCKVVNFSSQYGMNSYSAMNLVGPPRVFPQYGDFTRAFVTRKYGLWWSKAPSAAPSFSTSKRRSRHPTDFVELAFSRAVVPSKITIYETYNPGTIVRILACAVNDVGPQGTRTKSSWFELWSGPPDSVAPESRAFSPEIKVPPFATNVIRIELDHQATDYYPELDAVLLDGFATDEPRSPAPSMDDEKEAKVAESNRQLYHRLSASRSASPPVTSRGTFDGLPDELILHVFGFLDFLEVLAVSCVCRRFFTLGRKAHEGFSALDLQPHWMHVTDRFLFSISSRCDALHKLNLSWTGGGRELVSARGFERFLTTTGKSLHTLRLACCTFISDEALATVVTTCPQLTEVDLQCCQSLSGPAFAQLAQLTNLKRLNLYNTKVDAASLRTITRHCGSIRHLNLGHSIAIAEWDDVIEQVAQNCPELQSLDLWRARSLTSRGVLAIARICPNLVELDIGWCRFVDCSECVSQLAAACPLLVKLFLTAVRTTTDTCINSLAMHCPKLRQVDVLGAGHITEMSIRQLLDACSELELLDVSFCRNIDFPTVRGWRDDFPQVAIKKSFSS